MNADHYALLVGINYYPGLGDGLQGAERDALAVADWLKRPDGGGVPESNIRTLVTSVFHPPWPGRPGQAQPNAIDFENELYDLVKDPSTGGFRERRGRLYLFLSGHGFSGLNAEEGALYSADAMSPGFRHIAATRYAVWLRDQGVYEEIVLIMDSCRTISGARTIAQPSLLDAPNPNAIQDVTLLTWYATPSGAKAKEEADETGVVGGVFSRVLLDALQNATPDESGRVTASRVAAYIHRVWPSLREGCPIPVLSVDAAREVVFATRKVAAPPAQVEPAPGAGKEIALRIRAADAGTEVFLSDSEFVRVGKGVGELSARVRPGSYTARLRSGLSQVDMPLDVPNRLPKGQREILVSCEPVLFETPIPLPDTATYRREHAEAWVRISRARGLRVGRGGSLFVMTRDAEKTPGKPTSHRPWRGLSLCAADGSELLSFDDAPHRDEDLGYAAARLELDPGTYLLRVTASDVDGALEMPVCVAPGWQTQAFLASKSESRRRVTTSEGSDETEERVRSARRPDLSNAGVLLVRQNGRVAPGAESLRLTELVRLGLAAGRANIRREDLDRLVVDGASDPMLGILGAQVLLAGDAGAADSLGGLVDALAAMVPEHPDVRALQLAVGREAPSGASFAFPPTLLSSWQQVVRASATAPAIVPAESFSATVAGGVLSSGPWLMWRRTPALVAALRAWARSLAEKPAPPVMVAAAVGLMSAMPPTPPAAVAVPADALEGLGDLAGLREIDLVAPEAVTTKLTPAQFDLLSVVDSSLRKNLQPSTEELVDALGVPAATLADLVDGLRPDDKA